jgi:hypothetical protein
MQLYHGANGDNILSILKNRYIKPGDQNEVFFGRFNYRALYMHGGDIRRKASFVIAVEVDMPAEVKKQFTATSGVQDTLKVITPVHLPAKVLELFVRRRTDDGYEEQRIKGELAIKQYLQNKEVLLKK